MLLVMVAKKAGSHKLSTKVSNLPQGISIFLHIKLEEPLKN
jgi:hypothetical protein